MAYKAIGFDYWGVVYGVPGHLFMDAMADLLHIQKEELKKVYFSHNHLANEKNMSWDDLWDRVAKSLNRSELSSDIHAFISGWDSNLKVNSNIIELIDILKSRGYKVGLLSNYASGLQEKLVQNNIVDCFDVVSVSGEIGIQKPHAGIFHEFCDKLSIQTNELVFIDDSTKSLEKAEEIGYTPILYRDYESLCGHLMELKILSQNDLK